MRYDPDQLAAALVAQFGLEDARSRVMAHVMKAQEDVDLFALSVWRDVKRILGQLAADNERAA